jgi:uncharacterized membrane-anchored protein
VAVECVAVTIAMYCLVQFYIQIKDDISQYNPFLKILSIKLVIFLSFWQSVSADPMCGPRPQCLMPHVDMHKSPLFRWGH